MSKVLVSGEYKSFPWFVTHRDNYCIGFIGIPFNHPWIFEKQLEGVTIIDEVAIKDLYWISFLSDQQRTKDELDTIVSTIFGEHIDVFDTMLVMKDCERLCKCAYEARLIC